MADTPDSFARKRRILAHLAKSRRARQSSRFDDKSAAAQARIQRRLEARRQQTGAHQTEGPEAASFVEVTRKAVPDTHKTFPEAVDREGAESAQLSPDSPTLRKLFSGGSLASQNPQSTTVGRSLAIQNSPGSFAGPEQGEIARLQAKAQAETQRAELVIALLEDVLSASTARIVKQQARLEAMQAQINSLHGR